MDLEKQDRANDECSVQNITTLNYCTQIKMSPGTASLKFGGGGAPGVSNAANGEGGDRPACASRLGTSGGEPVLFLTKCSTLQSTGIFPTNFSTISLSFSKTFCELQAWK